jgi:hypothetical protein
MYSPAQSPRNRQKSESTAKAVQEAGFFGRLTGNGQACPFGKRS